MRLRNIFRIKEEIDQAALCNLADKLRRGDSIITNHKIEHEKIPLEVEDLVASNMDIIKSLIELRKKE